ncbi:TPA: type I glyceraldehyde-3-phosphate dehydrogenase, partial [bacterium]|nr:type I glyceraldehyde-3-phosphate dehydrogenase [bacterium]
IWVYADRNPIRFWFYSVLVNGKEIKVTAEKDPANIPWKDLGAEIVIESTGFFTDAEKASKHITAGAKKVIISAPAKGEDITIVLGVNHDKYDKAKHNIISNASCTTNCLAPVAKVLVDEFGVKRGFMTTVHSYTNDQKTLDAPHSDLRRARSAAVSIIPTSTGAAKAIGLVIPELKGKMDGFAMRVPTPNISVVDLVVELEKDATIADINSAMKNASETRMKGILQYIDEPLVSVDFRMNSHSSIFDSLLTMAMPGGFVKVVSWYDNEWAYSTRVGELVKFIA